ncbi:DUF6318 family protein [Rothia sp. CCM 9416]|uniref:DUF6318 family protein n=1 Tax=Rothia sp. CCM 9416 TaxID=3402655 RepID=UPI003AE44DD0
MRTAQRTLTLTALALLVLTGCGEQKTGSIPEPSDSSSASSASGASSSVSASATAQETEHYSGGSKAPDGEYRPADEFGPAQNVPKPVKPEGMNVETTEGMELFINYWNDLRNYAMQTGDVTEITKLVDESYTQELEFYESLNEIYNSGGWVIGGTRQIHYNKDLLTSDGNGAYSIGCNFDVENLVLWSDGKAQVFDNSDYIYNGIELKVKFKNNHWTVVTADILESQNG